MGTLVVHRRWWGARCGCVAGGYLIDALLGIDGHCTRLVQQQVCRLGADVSFAKVQEHLQGFWQLAVGTETIRRICHLQGERMRRWQPQDPRTPQEFRAAAGAPEFTADAGKVNTWEEGWKDLKIGVFHKRPAGPAAPPAEWDTRPLPPPTACIAWAAVAASKRFRRNWRAWSRRLGVDQPGELHVLADGAGWIWRAVQRVFSGSQQTLDIYHACQHLAQAGERLYGEDSEAAREFLQRGRQLLLAEGWTGVCRLVAEEYQKQDTPRRRLILEKMIAYFSKHTTRLAYRERLAAGQSIGSGAVEGWAKTLGLRLKARGARWRRRNVPRMAALACVRNSSQWSSYWSAAA